ncbi:MAG: phosphoribosylformylglycinamidine cyclo-ligase [Candidatus Omnitrophota bacterium]
MKSKKSLTYKSSGVDIEKGNLFVKKISSLVKSTSTSGVISDIGSFGGLFGLEAKKYKNPVLVSSTDGVGTKLMIAQKLGWHKGVGVDLVAMCVNDVATSGADPLFFLDYISTGKVDPGVLKDIVAGIAGACKKTGYALIGGETAEMPDMYSESEYDLAGFCVGVVDKEKIIDGSSLRKGDVVLGLASSGLHSNGFSLVRKVFSLSEQKALAKELLKPTRLYVKELLQLQKEVKVKGIAHITGGAYVDKIPRIIPKGLGIALDKKSWVVPKIFGLMQEAGNISDSEMYKVFNMGLGMVVVISPKDVDQARKLLDRVEMKNWIVGEVVKGNKSVTFYC